VMLERSGGGHSRQEQSSEHREETD
jgi:hypothetical protein